MTTDKQQPPTVPETPERIWIRRDGLRISQSLQVGGYFDLGKPDHADSLLYARVHQADDGRARDLAEGLTSQLFEVEGFGDYTNAQQREAAYDLVAKTIQLALLPQLSSSEQSEVERLRQHCADLEHDLNESVRQCNDDHGS